MELVIQVLLPLSLAIIMLSLGIGLTVSDFTRVLTRPLAFGVGAVAQVILVPLVGYLIAVGFGLGPELAVGIMLLSFCPGGVTSNMFAKLARGDVALSVSLTAVISLLSILTVPALIAWTVTHFMGADAPEVDITALTLTIFLISTLPVLIGVLIRHVAADLAVRIEPLLSRIALILFVLIVLAALAGNWSTFTQNVVSLGPALIALNVILLGVGLILARAVGLSWTDQKTISVEAGIQNVTLGITLAAIISGQSEGFSTMALPSGVYGITMYLVVFPFILWYRRP